MGTASTTTSELSQRRLQQGRRNRVGWRRQPEARMRHLRGRGSSPQSSRDSPPANASPTGRAQQTRAEDGDAGEIIFSLPCSNKFKNSQSPIAFERYDFSRAINHYLLFRA